MQYKMLSTYSIARQDSTYETVNAASIEEAIKNLTVSEKELAITAVLLKEGPIKTLIKDAPTEVDFYVHAVPQGIPRDCRATPENAILHSGDLIRLEAFPGHGYNFVGWKMEDQLISTDPKFTFKIPEIENPKHYNRLNIMAEFQEKDVEWYCKVVPEEAEQAGCIAGPGKGTGPAKTHIELIACPEDRYKFDGWFRNSVELAKTKKLETVVEPLALDEEKAVYEARFSLKE